jgi:flagellar basal-body rod modification protein FlgD
MTTIASTSAAATTQSTAVQDRSALAANFDTFLTLLTQQLKNQDPTDPMDTAEFTQQLVQYSQVEQQINTNKNFETLISLQRTSAASAALGYLGKTVVTKGDLGSLENGSAKWTYQLPANASENQLVVSDSSGRIVRTLNGERGAGTHEFAWDGKGQNGETLADGVYRLEVRAKDSDGATVRSSISSTGIVQETDLSGTDPVLKIGARKAALADVIAIKSN